MTRVYAWPSSLTPADVAFNPRDMTVSGPPTLSGRAQTAAIDAGRWVANASRVAVTDPAKVRAFRALRAKMQGGAYHVQVPAWDDAQAPFPDGVDANASQSYSDDTFHTDGHGFYTPAIIVTLAAAVAVRDTLISATVTTAGTIEEGHLFSIRDRLHVVQEIVASSGGSRTLAIWPPIREAAPVGRRLNFERPVCRMRLASDQEMDLTLAHGWYGFPDIAFVEAA